MALILKTILLVEDSEDDQVLFLRTLKKAGIENPVSVVRDGGEALAYLKGEGTFADREKFPLPCALFLDLRLRCMDGWEVLKWLRTQNALKKMLVIVLTGSDDPKTVVEAYRLGAQSFLTKPLSESALKNLVQYFSGALTVTTFG